MKIVMSHIYILFFIVTFLISGNFLLSQEKNYLVRTFKKHKEAVNSVKISPDGRHLLSGSADKSIILWDIATGNDLLIIKDIPRKVQAVEFSPYGNYFLGNSGNIIKLWKINGEYINTFKGHATDIWSLKFAPDGKSFVSGSFDRIFRVWDFLEIRLLQTIEGHKKSVLTVTIDPAGKRIASGSLDESIRIWDKNTGGLVTHFYGHQENIYDLDFSPDEKYIASASRDKTVKIWDPEKGELIRTLSGHSMSVFAVQFSPDGYYLITGSLDQTTRLWELSTGNCIYTYTGHQGGVNDVCFSPDGKTFASCSNDQTIRLWIIEPEIFVNYYYKNELDKEISTNEFFAPKSKSESREAYRKRLDKAEEFKKEIHSVFYQEYKENLRKNKLIKKNE